MNKTALVITAVFFSIFVRAQTTATTAVDDVLNAWHKAASDADFDTYFGLMTKNAVFIGTDATENWNRAAFEAYSKPHFDKGRAWSFTAVSRNVFTNATGDFAWFDELLSTQMKICRGSGVLHKVNGKWKIAHYVLSITVPNEHVSALISLKKEKDDMLLEQFSKN